MDHFDTGSGRTASCCGRYDGLFRLRAEGRRNLDEMPSGADRGRGMRSCSDSALYMNSGDKEQDGSNIA